MSTPRTDAAKFQSSQDPDVYNVDSEFAAQLETELAEMREELAIEHKSSTYFQSQLSAEREKVAKLKDIIQRASITFWKDGADGEIAAEMFRILGEARKETK